MDGFMLALKFIVLIVINLIGLGFSINLLTFGLSEKSHISIILGICCIVLNSLCIIVNLMCFLAGINELQYINQ